MTHHLKTWPEYFQEVKNGNKTFEIRKDDRNYQVGDGLILHEWNPKAEDYTESPIIIREVTYILKGGQFGVEKGYVVMGLK